MKILGFEITRPKMLTTVDTGGAGWFSVIRESFPGAWQRNVTVDSTRNVLAFAAVYACISLIANDIAKLRLKLCQNKDGIWEEITTGSPFLPVLRKPNRYQTRIQFLVQWVVSLLLYGNTYVFKERDARGVVKYLYVLDPLRVKPLIADDGSVYYEIAVDELSKVEETITVRASEIIHDRMVPLFHRLVGVSPIFACGASATEGNRIQANSSKFFENMSRPSGILTAPGNIPPEVAARLKQDIESAISGVNLGRLLVAGSGLTYTAMNAIPATDAQLIEQQKWTVEDVARAFGVPLYKIQAGSNPTFTNGAQFDQDYYKQTLQAKIESIEVLLDEGLELPTDYGVELDTEGLLRMDPKTQAEVNEIEVRSATITPDEARLIRNRPKVKGGGTPYLQQQNYSLEALAKRDAGADPFGTAKPEPKPETPPDDDEEVELSMGLLHITAQLNKGPAWLTSSR